MGIGARIKDLLKDRKLTIKALSEKTGIPVNTLYSITKRNNQSVRSDNLEKIASALDVSVSYLLGEALNDGSPAVFDGEDEMTPEELEQALRKAEEMTARLREVGQKWKGYHDMLARHDLSSEEYKALIDEYDALLKKYDITHDEMITLINDVRALDDSP